MFPLARATHLGIPVVEPRPDGLGTQPKNLVAVDPPAKVLLFFTVWGCSGKPNLISTKKLKSKDPTQ